MKERGKWNRVFRHCCIDQELPRSESKVVHLLLHLGSIKLLDIPLATMLQLVECLDHSKIDENSSRRSLQIYTSRELRVNEAGPEELSRE